MSTIVNYKVWRLEIVQICSHSPHHARYDYLNPTDP
jgi:hypothetical protein